MVDESTPLPSQNINSTSCSSGAILSEREIPRASSPSGEPTDEFEIAFRIG